ncbi:hypothetical protein LMG27952_05900 [Paraburkholderia hiiakae]|uniref:Uncharacterized protein n=1 Tax=Paraburkholderia hiiakae TaxID=1081782 RepID=A0ABM8P3R3_9BURK|nr:hypothetical protein LMG27952_05900 [Paraburkholderia hiiakae]
MTLSLAIRRQIVRLPRTLAMSVSPASRGNSRVKLNRNSFESLETGDNLNDRYRLIVQTMLDAQA